MYQRAGLEVPYDLVLLPPCGRDWDGLPQELAANAAVGSDKHRSAGSPTSYNVAYSYLLFIIFFNE